MKRIIHRLREQPEEHRRHLLHILTLVSGFLLLVFWTFSLGSNLSSPETTASVEEGLKPFSVFKGNIIDGYKSISE